ncbi:MAG: CsiV family protein [Panacagrimonas sp.]
MAISTSKFLVLALVLVTALALSGAARAETWRVDLIVFRFLGPADEAGIPAGVKPAAPAAEAIELDNTARLAAAGITLLPEAEFGLGPEWASLRSSREFRPMLKLAWLQKNPPTDRGPRLRIRAGARLSLSDPASLSAVEVSEIEGSISLLQSRYLHLDTDLVFTQGGDVPESWRLEERRRMRSDELHHLDSPRAGVLVKVSKAAP